jgi:hypothetical protein
MLIYTELLFFRPIASTYAGIPNTTTWTTHLDAIIVKK